MVTLPSRNRPILLLTACARATLDSREKINTPLFLIFDQIYSDRKRDTHKNTKRIICVTAHSRRKNGSSPRVVASRCNRLNWYCSASDHIFFFLIDLFLWVPLLSDRSLVNENQIKEKLHNETRRNQRMPGGFANHQIPVAALNKIGSSSNLALEYAI